MAEVGNAIGVVVVTGVATAVEELAGEWCAAELLMREAVEQLDAMDHGWQDRYRLELALLVARQGRLEEAREAVAACEPSADPWALLVRASILAVLGRHAEAVALARAAAEELAGRDSPHMRARAYEALADVLVAAGRRAEAVTVLEEAARAWDAKAATLPAEKARARAAELGA